MKKMIAGLAVLSVFCSLAVAATVKPTSNVLGDTAATASTLVYRDTDGVFDAASLQDGTVVTAKLATNSVTTAKMLLDLSVGQVACITTKKQLGYCSNLTAGTAVCNSCN